MEYKSNLFKFSDFQGMMFGHNDHENDQDLHDHGTFEKIIPDHEIPLDLPDDENGWGEAELEIEFPPDHDERQSSSVHELLQHQDDMDANNLKTSHQQQIRESTETSDSEINKHIDDQPLSSHLGNAENQQQQLQQQQQQQQQQHKQQPFDNPSPLLHSKAVDSEHKHTLSPTNLPALHVAPNHHRGPSSDIVRYSHSPATTDKHPADNFPHKYEDRLHPQHLITKSPFMSYSSNDNTDHHNGNNNQNYMNSHNKYGNLNFPLMQHQYPFVNRKAFSLYGSSVGHVQFPDDSTYTSEDVRMRMKSIENRYRAIAAKMALLSSEMNS